MFHVVFSFLPALLVFTYESLSLVPSHPQIVLKFAAVSHFDVSPNAAEFLESLTCGHTNVYQRSGLHSFVQRESISIEVRDGFVARP